MDDGREDRARQYAQQRIFEHDEHLLERRDIPQAGNGPGHGFHAEHQRGKAEQDHAGVLFLRVLAEHIKDDANERQNRREGGRFQ